MEQTLSQHIGKLEQKIITLKKELRGELSSFDRAEKELALLNAEEALTLFHRAYDTEQRVPN